MRSPNGVKKVLRIASFGVLLAAAPFTVSNRGVQFNDAKCEGGMCCGCCESAGQICFGPPLPIEDTIVQCPITDLDHCQCYW
ncbi:MAG TPA: hypothetical protein VHE78_14285 [Gemmatimonadaceae bacterium]|nr:hypothetical protein [Gemmatimonadaceae bacterium]